MEYGSCPYRCQIPVCEAKLSHLCDKTNVAGVEENADPIIQKFVKWAERVFGETIFATPGQLTNICAQYCSSGYGRKGSQVALITGIRSGHPRLGNGGR